MQNTKTRAATFACCRRFPQKRARTFSVRIGPDALRHLPMPPGYLPFLHCHLIFYFFSIFCIQHISVSLPTTSTRSRQHIPLSFCLLPELYAFIIFSFEVFSFFRNPSHLLPAPAGRHPTQHSYPSTNQNLAFRLAGYTLPASFSFKALSAFHQPLHTLPAPAGRILPAAFLSIHRPEPRVPALPAASTPHLPYLFIQSNLSLSSAITPSSGASRQYLTRIILIPQNPFHLHPALLASTTPPAPNNYQHFPQTPSAISRCLRATTFPAALPQASTPPIPHSFLFLFSFFYLFFSFSFFSFFLLLFSFFFFSFFLFFSSLYF